MEFKQGVIKRNNYLFPVIDDDHDNTKNKPLFEASEEKQFAEEFGWIPMLYTYSKENSISMNKSSEESALEFLTFMNFWVRKCELEQNKLNRINNVNRNTR